MGNIFEVELCGNDWSCNLNLPATDHELLDALEIIKMKPGDLPEWEMLNCEGFNYLYPYLTGECSIYELNTLSRRLEAMDHRQLAAFEGLFQIAQAKKESPMSLTDLMTYANSTDCCHVVGEALNDAQLGRFYAENGFVEELDDIPDSVFEKLDFSKIGKEMREAEGGVYTRYGYVLQNAALRTMPESCSQTPKAPGYAFRVAAGRFPFESGDEPEKYIHLELPATKERLDRALEETGAAAWDEAAVFMMDSAIPGIVEDMDCGGMSQLNRLACLIKESEQKGELQKFKAVLTATGCDHTATAIEIAEQLDNYVCDLSLRNAADVARAELRALLDDDSRSVLEKYINLYAYGEELMAAFHSVLTPYGHVVRKDGQPIQAQQPDRGGMEMM